MEYKGYTIEVEMETRDENIWQTYPVGTTPREDQFITGYIIVSEDFEYINCASVEDAKRQIDERLSNE